MIAFLRRLVGTHPDQKAVNESFNAQIRGMAQRNTELEELRETLMALADRVTSVGEETQYSTPPRAAGPL